MMHSRISARIQASSKSSRALALLLFAIACLAGCSHSFKVKGAWNDGSARTHIFRKLLVVGVSPDYDQRCSFEWALTPKLRSATVQAIASCSAMKMDEPLSRESIERVIAAQGVDGVVASRLVSASGHWGAYGMPVIYGEFQQAPSVFTLERKMVVTTQLYETRGASLVYSLESTAKAQDSRDIILAEISPAITARLRKDGVIP